VAGAKVPASPQCGTRMLGIDPGAFGAVRPTSLAGLDRPCFVPTRAVPGDDDTLAIARSRVALDRRWWSDAAVGRLWIPKHVNRRDVGRRLGWRVSRSDAQPGIGLERQANLVHRRS
jgi:hypothetical protein